MRSSSTLSRRTCEANLAYAREEFKNGHRYYPFDDKPLVQLPRDARAQPSRDALAWHFENVFLRNAG